MRLIPLLIALLLAFAVADEALAPTSAPTPSDYPPAPPAPHGIKILSHVPVVTLVPGAPFAAQMSKLDKPLILKNTTSTLWKCNKWTPSFLAEKLDVQGQKVLVGVKRTRHPQRRFNYYHRAPFNLHPSLFADYKPTTFIKLNMSTSEYFALFDPEEMQRSGVLSKLSPPEPLEALNEPGFLEKDPSKQAWPDGQFSYAFAAKLDDLGDLFLDILPIDSMMVKPPDFDPENSHLFRQTFAWFTPAKSVTPMHFDLFHNFYRQIYGYKHFLLLPPEAWERLYPYPLLHPGGRMSQVDLSEDDPRHPLSSSSSSPSSSSSSASHCAEGDSTAAASAAQGTCQGEQAAQQQQQQEQGQDQFKFPNYGELEAYSAVLGPGDVLYLPPMWWHEVTAITPSISVSVWSPFEGTELASKAAEEIALPISASWDRPLQVAALRLYLESIVENLRLGMNVAEFVHWTLLESRYKRIGQVSTEPSAERFCFNEELQELLLSTEGVKESFEDQLKLVLRLFKRIVEVAGQARRDMILADFFELAANQIVGPLNVKQFFHDLVYC